MLSQDRKAQAGYSKRFGRSEFADWRRRGAIPEELAISEKEMCWTRVCPLLRLGEVSLADAYWKRLSGPAQAVPENAKSDYQKELERDPYLLLAREWAWMAFDRAVCAHMRGDDVVSLETAALLARAQAKIESAAADRHFRRPRVMDPKDFNRELPNAPYLGFLGQLPALVADEQRRVKEGKIDRVLDHPAEYKDKSKRIAALIRDLEEVSAREWGQPGGVALGFDPVPKALQKGGVDAVEPLLDCLAKDDRLTRSVSFGRDFGEGRHLLTVAEAAYVSICYILQVDQFGPLTHYRWRGDPADRAAVVAEIRTFWEKHKGLTPAEGWYRILADDHAQPAQWLEAASRIVQPVDVEAHGGWTMIAARKPGEVPPLRGEPLRAKVNPSVAELMAKRVPQIAAADKENSSNEIFFADDATQVALALAKWDIKAAMPVMRVQLTEVKRVDGLWPDNSQGSLLVGDQVKLFTALKNAGDAGINRDYAIWIRALPVPESPSQIRLFQPLWQKPRDPDIAAAADWLFNDPASPWHCLPKTKDTFGEITEIVASPLLGVAAFQKSLLTNLADKSSLGAIWLQSGQLQTSPGLNLHTQIVFVDDDPLLPKAGEKRTVRVCDWFALQLSRLEGSPEFEPYWPQENRNAAIQAAIAFVRDWSDRFAWNDMQKAFFDPPFGSARMIFQRRDRPATEADVRAHTAIFSLAAEGEVRAVRLDPFPTKAKWTTFKRFLVRYQGYDEKTRKQKVMTDFDQQGWLWQAEERREGGKWKRYYGFVGRHIVAKVPAEEIELAN